MHPDTTEPSGYRVGDKLRIRTGPYAGSRATVRAVSQGTVSAELLAGDVLELRAEELTNFSLAARRAWRSMPKRAGRPRLAAPRKKLVSVRLDLDVWRMLAQAAEQGLIPSREQAINTWLRERLVCLLPTALPIGASLLLESHVSGEHDG